MQRRDGKWPAFSRKKEAALDLRCGNTEIPELHPVVSFGEGEGKEIRPLFRKEKVPTKARPTSIFCPERGLRLGGKGGYSPTKKKREKSGMALLSYEEKTVGNCPHLLKRRKKKNKNERGGKREKR